MFRAARTLLIFLLAASLSACASWSTAQALPEREPSLEVEAACNVAPDAGQPQYIVGYGSLMQDESRKRTSPQAGPAHPVEVTGYRRGWFARGDPLGFSTTYLGVAPVTHARINAVVYQVEPAELLATDRREASYCRRAIPLANIKLLETTPWHMAAGQAWIYVNKPEAIATPSARYPIVQSYVDIFVSGCLEQEQRFGVEGFARQCLATTGDWSEHWVNDRLYPRRPFIHQPRARQIDALLAGQLPQYFAHIRIEQR